MSSSLLVASPITHASNISRSSIRRDEMSQRLEVASRDYELKDLKSSVFQSFPVEIVRYIIELAVENQDQAALNILLVSHAFHNWLSPIVYHTVALHQEWQFEAFHRALQTCPSLIAEHVKILYLPYLRWQAMDKISNVVVTCTRLEQLTLDNGLWITNHTNTCLWPAPWEVVLFSSGTTCLHIRHPILRGVTHLYYDDFSPQLPDTQDRMVDACCLLPQLTHIGIGRRPIAFTAGVEGFIISVKRLLSSITSLQMLVVLSYDESLRPNGRFVGPLWASLSLISDNKLFVRPGISIMECAERFQFGATVWYDAALDWRKMMEA